MCRGKGVLQIKNWNAPRQSNIQTFKYGPFYIVKWTEKNQSNNETFSFIYSYTLEIAKIKLGEKKIEYGFL